MCGQQTLVSWARFFPVAPGQGAMQQLALRWFSWQASGRWSRSESSKYGGFPGKRGLCSENYLGATTVQGRVFTIQRRYFLLSKNARSHCGETGAGHQARTCKGNVIDDSRGTNWRRWSIYYIHTIRSGVDGPIWKGINTIDPGVDGPMFDGALIGSNVCSCGYWIWQYNQSLNVAHRGPAGPRGQAPPESAGNATSADVRVRSWKGAPRGFEKGCAPSSS